MLVHVRGKLWSWFSLLLMHSRDQTQAIGLIQQAPVGGAISQPGELLLFLRLHFAVHKHELFYHLFFLYFLAIIFVFLV